MRQPKLFNALLWIVNAALGAATVVFAFQYLLFPDREDLLKNVQEDTGPSGKGRQEPKADYSNLQKLPNPLTKAPPIPDKQQTDLRAKLLGGYRIADRDESEVAFLLVTPSGPNVNAYRGQPITLNGQAVGELQGWSLLRLTENGALFSNGQKEVELRRDDASVAALPTGKADVKGASFDLAQSKTKKVSSSDTAESWVIDLAEAEWANTNIEQLLAEVQLSAYPSGGVKIDYAGSVASQRGFMDGDVVKSINGRSIRDRTDLINLASDPQFRNAGAMSVSVERAGRQMTLTYRPGPR